MSVNVSTVDYLRFGKCVRIANDDAEVLVTVDVGPRIISYRRMSGENLLFNDLEGKNIVTKPSIMETFGKPVFELWGGHRMWATPEHMPLSYYPDNEPVAWTEIENGVVFTPNPQRVSDWQYTLTVTLADNGTETTVKMDIKNLRDEVRRAGAWGITQMRKGGKAICPMNHDDSLIPLPDKMIAFWPYCDMQDKRFAFGKDCYTLKHIEGEEAPFKCGINSTAGWLAYVTGEDVFVKKVAYDKDAAYPDFGSNVETYVDGFMLEIEGLSPMKDIGKDESVSLTEKWSVTTLDDEMIKPYI